MTAEITRPARIRWRLDDAAKGRSCRPLGAYPEVATACIEGGASFTNVARPLHVELARLRSLCNRKGAPLAEAFITESREQGDAELAQMELAECIQNPPRSTLERYIREARQYSDALMSAIEAAEGVLHTRGAK